MLNYSCYAIVTLFILIGLFTGFQPNMQQWTQLTSKHLKNILCHNILYMRNMNGNLHQLIDLMPLFCFYNMYLCAQ